MPHYIDKYLTALFALFLLPFKCLENLEIEVSFSQNDEQIKNKQTNKQENTTDLAIARFLPCTEEERVFKPSA